MGKKKIFREKMFLTIILLSFISFTFANDVISIDSKNFDSILKGKDAFIKFYAPWCGHCKALAPTWEKAAKELNEKTIISKVDCTVESTLCSEFDVKGYPTLIHKTSDEKFTEYNGKRSIEGFEEYISNPNGQSINRNKINNDENESKHLIQLSNENFEKETKGNRFFLKFMAPWCGFCKKLKPTMSKLADELNENKELNANVGVIDCTLSNNRALCDEYKVKGFPTLYMLEKNGDAMKYIDSD